MIHATYSLFIISIEKCFVKRFLKKIERHMMTVKRNRKMTDKNYKVFTNGGKMSMIVLAHRFKDKQLGRGGPGSISTSKPWENGLKSFQ